MKRIQCKLVFSIESWWMRTKDQRNHKYKQIIIVLIALLMPISVKASVPCSGRFVNPISDVCWSCLLPISIGPVKIGGGVVPSKCDTDNPDSPLCMCIKGTPPLPCKRALELKPEVKKRWANLGKALLLNNDN